MGGSVHDMLEKIMKGEAKTSELRTALNDDLERADMLGLSFPKDFKGNDSIREGWIADMEHFVDHFKPLDGRFGTEEFLLYKLDDDHYIQGYADLVKYNEDGSQDIIDWKTSSLYSGEDIKKHGMQLVLYAMAKEQAGIHINRIAWYFLKYVTVSWLGKKRISSKEKTLLTKHINRRKLVQELEKYLRDDLIEAGYDDIDTEFYIADALHNNNLEGLPEEVRLNYTVKPCIVEYQFSNETKSECIEWVNEMICAFESRVPENMQEWGHRSFTKLNKYGREIEDTFFCNCLCSHRNICEPLKEFHEEQNRLKEDLESFL